MENLGDNDCRYISTYLGALVRTDRENLVLRILAGRGVSELSICEDQERRLRYHRVLLLHRSQLSIPA